ncbi:MAG: hypothetical protein J7K98_02485, partial [Candidatus Aenigmarchaeota archaeon]|nr:hypothetical protein [Candidatus Aenigmarchaeota archaeon]
KSLVGINPAYISTVVLRPSSLEVNLENIPKDVEENFSDFLKEVLTKIYKIDIKSCFPQEDQQKQQASDSSS